VAAAAGSILENICGEAGLRGFRPLEIRLNQETIKRDLNGGNFLRTALGFSDDQMVNLIPPNGRAADNIIFAIDLMCRSGCKVSMGPWYWEEMLRPFLRT
jgi:hypothetical protein